MKKCPKCDKDLIVQHNLKTNKSYYKCMNCNIIIDEAGKEQEKKYEVPQEVNLIRALKFKDYHNY